jgi:hypothetical protein
MIHLIELYFYHFNIFVPLLHRPTFEKSLSSLLHLGDYDFGCTVLVVCAIGARYSSDPRVLGPEVQEHDVGWQWFEQVRPIRPQIGGVASVYELQLYMVSPT